MMTMKRAVGRTVAVFGLAVLLWAGIAPLSAATPGFPAFEASYKLKRAGVSFGEAVRTNRILRPGFGVYESRIRPNALFAVLLNDRLDESSGWELIDNKPLPVHYEYRQRGRKSRHVDITFDWAKGRVVNRINGKPWRMKIPNPTYDKALYQLALMQDLQDGRKALVYAVADGGTLKEYRFERLGRETIQTDLGKLETLKVRRMNDIRMTTLWCAARYGYLPVRVEQVEKDNTHYAMDIHKISGF